MALKPHTLIHVTHEAVEQIGGIGTVLEGLMISPVYKKHVGRSILVGPTATHISVDPEARLGDAGKVLYSSVDNIDRAGIGARMRPIEWAFNVAIIYGTRKYDHALEGRSGEAEVLLIDVFRPNHDRLNAFKTRLWSTFGLDSMRYERFWDYEEYTRLAEPAFYALSALLRPEDMPATLFSHEFMGMPAALQAILEGGNNFRTIFHAHECASARKIVEDHPGHDMMFYNVLDQAREKKLYIEDAFGPLDSLFRHALVSRTYLCDGIIAVGDRTRDELKFLSNRFDPKTVDLVYNGIPAGKVDLPTKLASRKMMIDYTKAVVGFEPDIIMTHVARPVISKGMWRDFLVCHELDAAFGKQGKKGVLYILTSAGGNRRPQDIDDMTKQYGWPRRHRIGYPDLVGPEEGLAFDVETFNAAHKNIQAVLVNQFGWSRQRIGSALPAKMDFADLRRSTDVEFGMATYEPFGISPLEPLCSGAICVISNACGCEGFVRHATGGKGSRNVIVWDSTKLDAPRTIDQLKAMTRSEREGIEKKVAGELAADLIKVLPTNNEQRAKLLAEGQKLVAKMGWDQVFEDSLLPLLDRVREHGGPIGSEAE